MYKTLLDEVGNARTATSRGFREPCDDPPRLPGAAISESSYIAAAQIREALETSSHPLTPSELARKLGISLGSLTGALTSATYACSLLYEGDKGRLGLLGTHETDD